MCFLHKWLTARLVGLLHFSANPGTVFGAGLSYVPALSSFTLKFLLCVCLRQGLPEWCTSPSSKVIVHGIEVRRLQHFTSFLQCVKSWLPLLLILLKNVRLNFVFLYLLHAFASVKAAQKNLTGVSNFHQTLLFPSTLCYDLHLGMV